MNTIEAMIAVMMLLGVVAVVMQLHSQSAKVLGDSGLYKSVRERRDASVRGTGISAGGSGGYNTYRRWFFCKEGRAGC